LGPLVSCVLSFCSWLTILSIESSFMITSEHIKKRVSDDKKVCIDTTQDNADQYSFDSECENVQHRNDCNDGEENHHGPDSYMIALKATK
jgi:hypothetical protein